MAIPNHAAAAAAADLRSVHIADIVPGAVHADPWKLIAEVIHVRTFVGRRHMQYRLDCTTLQDEQGDTITLKIYNKYPLELVAGQWIELGRVETVEPASRFDPLMSISVQRHSNTYVRLCNAPDGIRPNVFIPVPDARPVPAPSLAPAPAPARAAYPDPLCKVPEAFEDLVVAEGADDTHTCKICAFYVSSMLLTPCEHSSLCNSCARKIASNAAAHNTTPTCPFCRASVTQMFRIRLS